MFTEGHENIVNKNFIFLYKARKLPLKNAEGAFLSNMGGRHSYHCYQAGNLSFLLPSRLW